MKITNETLIQSQATCFMDGKDGWFSQTHQVYINGEKSEVTFEVTGSKKEKTKRIFFYKGCDYQEIKDVFIAAGYTYERTI